MPQPCLTLRRFQKIFGRSAGNGLICYADVFSLLPHESFHEKGTLQRAYPELVCYGSKIVAFKEPAS